MEQITRKDGRIYYGQRKCEDADDAYRRFRNDYHESVGRKAFFRLDRLGQRMERVHGFGFDFDGPVLPVKEHYGKTKYRLLGLVDISYCRLVGLWDMPELGDGEWERWLDWAFSRNSGALSLVGRNDKSGRTARRLNARYR